MTINDLPNIDNLSIITQYSEIIDLNTQQPVYSVTSYYHIPFLAWFIIFAVFLWFANRILIEFLIRWRK